MDYLSAVIFCLIKAEVPELSELSEGFSNAEQAKKNKLKRFKTLFLMH